MTPKAFIHNIHEICRSDLQHIVLPEVGARSAAWPFLAAWPFAAWPCLEVWAFLAACTKACTRSAAPGLSLAAPPALPAATLHGTVPKVPPCTLAWVARLALYRVRPTPSA